MFAAVLDVWSGRRPTTAIRELISADYVGHMLHLEDGERTAEEYGAWIERYRRDQPEVEFTVVAQTVVGDHLWSRLIAARADHAVAYGMNESRVRDGRLIEEWAVWSPWHHR